MFKKKLSVRLLLLLLVSGCSKENPVTENNETLIFQRDGIIESFGGDCSAVQVRTSSLGVLDFSGASRIKFNFTGYSDADLSSISVFYLDGNSQMVNLVYLPHRDQINSTQSIEINSPDYQGEIFLRLTLKSSVCTGQIFHIEFRDLKIYSID